VPGWQAEAPAPLGMMCGADLKVDRRKRLSHKVALILAVMLVGCGSRRVVELPAGVTEVHSEMVVEAGTELAGGTDTVLHVAPDFKGRAVIVVRGSGVRLRNFTIDGNRDVMEVRSGLPPSNQSFAVFTKGNGVLAEGVDGLRIEGVQFRAIAGFAVLVSHCRDVKIQGVKIADSGSRTPAGHNNATGGIQLEEGTSDFEVKDSEFQGIRGNGLWTHSLYTSPRNSKGRFAGNRFENIGRDALQVGHATDVRVENNSGRRIGFPVADVNMDDLAVPAALDTAGNVDASSYTRNRFEDVDGKCMDLDGFHDGEIRGNECINLQGAEAYRYGNFGIVMNNSNPDMQSRNIVIEDNRVEGFLFGGIFVIGSGHRIAKNRLLNLNRAHCNEEAARFGCYYGQGEPDMLRSGIYLGKGGARAASANGNVIEDNEITGFHMDTRCIGLAPGVLPIANTVRTNRCSTIER